MNLLDDVYGFWGDVTIDVPQDVSSGYKYSGDITMFIAKGTPPETGLEGTLALCQMPDIGEWQSISIWNQLHKVFDVPNIYASFYFTQDHGLY